MWIFEIKIVRYHLKRKSIMFNLVISEGIAKFLLKKLKVVVYDLIVRAEVIPVIILINDTVFDVFRILQQISKGGLQILRRS